MVLLDHQRVSRGRWAERQVEFFQIDGSEGSKLEMRLNRGTVPSEIKELRVDD
jgi:hypothetical protein